MIGKKCIFQCTQKIGEWFESNNKSIALNILFMPYNTEKIRPEYQSKHNF